MITIEQQRDFDDFMYEWRVRHAWQALKTAEATWQHVLADGHKRGLKINEVVQIAKELEKGVSDGPQ